MDEKNKINFKVAAIFSDNMVLQRDKPVNIFGTGTDGEYVRVSAAGNETGVKIRGGTWLAVLPPMPATKPGNTVEIIVSSGEERVVFKNAAVGEVWLAGGQSNMEYELQNCTGGKEILSRGRVPENARIRFYYTQKKCYMDDEFYRTEAECGWSEFGEDSGAWSAAGYFFAEKLASELGVTIGIIGCNWGGTSASAWVSRESLSRDIDLKTYTDEYDAATAGKTDEELNAAYMEYVEYDKAWNERAAVFYQENPTGGWIECQEACGKNLYPGPPAPINPFHPGALHTSMIKRTAPYTLKGFIYYQGESDDHKPLIYDKLLTRLIIQWREDWGDLSLPFIITELPMHRYNGDADHKHWCLVREAQEKTFKSVKNTGIAIITDCGEFNEIHPKNKKPVGERLALQALRLFYGRENLRAFAPMYDYHLIKEDMLELHFLYEDSGFTIKGEPKGFEIAGEDEIFKPVSPEFTGNKIILRSPDIKEPLFVRYLWTNYAEVNIFGSNGLPLAPFRSGK